MVQVYVAGEASTFDAVSIARTRKVWEPMERVPVARGEVQVMYEPLSREHSKVPASFELKVKVPVREVVEDAGVERRKVSGGVESELPGLYMNVRMTAMSSEVRVSIARTANVQMPGAGGGVISEPVPSQSVEYQVFGVFQSLELSQSFDEPYEYSQVL
jgi:hypothetical protein